MICFKCNSYLFPPNRTSVISRPFLEKNFLSEALISSKSLLEFKFPTNRENAGKQENTSITFGVKMHY